MSKFFFIFISIMAYLLLTSKSCSSDLKDDPALQEARLMRTKDSLKEAFESPYLSSGSLKAFEAGARHKLIDLADYLETYNNRSMDESFRDLARHMITSLFINENVAVNSILTSDKNGSIRSLTEFLNAIPSPGYDSVSLIFDSIQEVMPLSRTGINNYKGTLRFNRQLKLYSSATTVITNPVMMEVDILASKVSKPFGADTLKVWGLYLGNIKQY